jgi:hypothetical protein
MNVPQTAAVLVAKHFAENIHKNYDRQETIKIIYYTMVV